MFMDIHMFTRMLLVHAVFVPPGGWATVTMPQAIGGHNRTITGTYLQQSGISVFYYFNAIGFAFSLTSLLMVCVVYTHVPSKAGQVKECVDLFGAYVRSLAYANNPATTKLQENLQKELASRVLEYNDKRYDGPRNSVFIIRVKHANKELKIKAEKLYKLNTCPHGLPDDIDTAELWALVRNFSASCLIDEIAIKDRLLAALTFIFMLSVCMSCAAFACGYIGASLLESQDIRIGCTFGGTTVLTCAVALLSVFSMTPFEVRQMSNKGSPSSSAAGSRQTATAESSGTVKMAQEIDEYQDLAGASQIV